MGSFQRAGVAKERRVWDYCNLLMDACNKLFCVVIFNASYLTSRDEIKKYWWDWKVSRAVMKIEFKNVLQTTPQIATNCRLKIMFFCSFHILSVDICWFVDVTTVVKLEIWTFSKWFGLNLVFCLLRHISWNGWTSCKKYTLKSLKRFCYLDFIRWDIPTKF